MKGTEMTKLEEYKLEYRPEMKRRKRKGYRWNFYKMHPSLQILSILLGGLAFVGWTLMGTWFLYFLMGN